MKIKLFNNNYGQIRVLMINRKEYFVGKDIANMLGYSNTKQAILQHCKKAVTMGYFQGSNSDTLEKIKETFGNSWQQTKLIPESDVWRLIIKSNKPEAEKIENWIMEEILPSIRKNGYYIKKNLTEEQESKLVA